MRSKHYISAVILGTFLLFTGMISPSFTLAQSAENECDAPDFQIMSDNQVYAITGESFSYYVVRANFTPYEVSSSLPTGLSFNSSTDQITGTPQTAGDYTIEFSASNDCGTTVETINLTVVDSSSAVAQGSTNQAANVGLNEIPDTGLDADSALTITFYVMALLAVAAWFTRRVYTPAAVSVGGGTGAVGDEGHSFAAVMRGSFIPKGHSIVSESVRPTRSTQYRQTEKTEPAQSQTTQRFGDDIRRP